MNIDDVDKAILKHLADGDKVKEVADKVNLSPRTVEKRIYRACKKNRARNRMELLAKYVTFVL